MLHIEWPIIWEKGFTNKLLDSNDKIFCYKLKHRVLPTRDVLLKMQKVPDPLCPLCRTENESHQHLFIYCSGTINAWVFVEGLLRKYTGNKYLYLTDLNRILGYQLRLVQSVVVVKMLRQIWNVRCKLVFNSHWCPTDLDIIHGYERSLRTFLLLEHKRMCHETFKACYTINKALMIMGT